MQHTRYSEIVSRIDVDAFEAAIGFEPISHSRGNDIGYCLWPERHQHGDTTGKFAIHRELRVWNCYKCGGGSLLSLAMELYGFSWEEGIDWLIQFTQPDEQSDSQFAEYYLGLLADTHERVQSMPYFNDRVLDRFTGSRDYFYSRGISLEVMEVHHLCASASERRPAPIKRTREGEIIKIDEDYYGPVAIFPHYWQDRLVGWQSRWMDWDAKHERTPRWLAKYTNTSDFPKAETLFNYAHALEARAPIVVCESVPTVLFLQSQGVPAVSYFGGDVTEAQLRLLRRFQQGVILAPDNDSTGDSLLKQATPYLLRFIPVFHADRVEGQGADLGDYASAPDPGGMLREHLRHFVSPATGFDL